MNLESKIKRHGYHLMSLASLGMFCVALMGLLMMALPYQDGAAPESSWWLGVSGLRWDQIIHLDGTGKALVAASCLIWTLAYLLPLFALRRLGSRLYRQEALTLPVADAFRWLAHSLLANAALLMSSGFLIGFWDGFHRSHIHHSTTLDFSGFYVWIIACLCLYSIAHLMRLAVLAADDARSIV